MAKFDKISKYAEEISSVLNNRHNIVAVIARNSSILAIAGNNMAKSTPRYYNYLEQYSKCIHAEFTALKQVRWSEQKNNDMYIFRFMKDGGYGDSMPCEDCYKNILESGAIRRLFYYKNNELVKEIL